MEKQFDELTLTEQEEAMGILSREIAKFGKVVNESLDHVEQHLVQTDKTLDRIDETFVQTFHICDRVDRTLDRLESTLGGLAERRGSAVASTWAHHNRDLHGNPVEGHCVTEYGSVSYPVRKRIY